MEEVAGTYIITQLVSRRGGCTWYKDMISPKETKTVLQPLLIWFKIIHSYASAAGRSSFVVRLACEYINKLCNYQYHTDIEVTHTWSGSKYEMIGGMYSKMIQCFVVKGYVARFLIYIYKYIYIYIYISKCKMVIITKWYQFHATDECCFIFNDHVWH